VNFNSPLKSRSIVEFWGRWHITLTRFLTAYLYTPIVMYLTRRRMARGQTVLRGKRSSASAVAILIGVPTFVTMTISGFWHGAGAQFIVWGLSHAVMLTINQAWRTWRPRFWPDQASYQRIMGRLGFVLTFGGFVTTIVFFRADSVGSAISILGSMFGSHGIAIPHAIGDRLGPLGVGLQTLGVSFDWSSGSQFLSAIVWLAVLFIVSTRLPNSLELLQRYEPALDFQTSEPDRDGQAAAASSRHGPFSLVPRQITLSGVGAVMLAAMFVAGVLALGRGGGFIYWKF
jgi:hypothetical protein